MAVFHRQWLILNVVVLLFLIVLSPHSRAAQEKEEQEDPSSLMQGTSCGAMSDVNAFAQYEELNHQLEEILPSLSSDINSGDKEEEEEERPSVVLSASRDSSQIRDQSYKSHPKYKLLNLSNWTQILEFQEYHPETKGPAITVQAKVTMDQLVTQTLQRYQAIPAVVPEFKSITVGGAIVGAALESSSFRFGQFSDTVLECVVLLANGTLAKASPTNRYADLFHALPGSHGSFGIVLEATLQLVYVASNELVRVAATRYDFALDGMRALTGKAADDPTDAASHDFLDALSYPHGPLVVITGTLLKNGDAEEQDMGIVHIEMNSSGLWFYEHLEDRLLLSTEDDDSSTAKNTTTTFTMSVRDYLFRYDYGAFWMSRPQAFSWKAVWQEPKLLGPFAMASRRLRPYVGSMYTTTNLYRVLHQLDKTAVAERFIIMDAYIPVQDHNASRYLNFIRQTLPVSVPIWLCPVRGSPYPQQLSPSGAGKRANGQHHDGSSLLLLNVAVWGRVSDNRGVDYVAAMEEVMIKLGGRKMLYSPTNMTVDDLYQAHVNGTAYWDLRRKLDPNGIFPPLHEKLQIGTTVRPPKEEYWSFQRLLSGFKYWMTRLLL